MDLTVDDQGTPLLELSSRAITTEPTAVVLGRGTCGLGPYGRAFATAQHDTALYGYLQSMEQRRARRIAEVEAERTKYLQSRTHEGLVKAHREAREAVVARREHAHERLRTENAERHREALAAEEARREQDAKRRDGLREVKAQAREAHAAHREELARVAAHTKAEQKDQEAELRRQFEADRSEVQRLRRESIARNRAASRLTHENAAKAVAELRASQQAKATADRRALESRLEAKRDEQRADATCLRSRICADRDTLKKTKEAIDESRQAFLRGSRAAAAAVANREGIQAERDAAFRAIKDRIQKQRKPVVESSGSDSD